MGTSNAGSSTETSSVGSNAPASEPLPPPDVTLKGFLPRDPFVGWWTLRGQLTLAAILFGVSIVLAIFLATQRDFVERTLKEVYTVGPEWTTVAKAALQGQLPRTRFEQLQPEGRQALFNAWMTEPSPGPKGPPVTLTDYDVDFYVACCERALVCGDAAQQQRALEFLQTADRREAIPMLHKYIAFLQRQGRAEWAAEVEKTVAQLQRNNR